MWCVPTITPEYEARMLDILAVYEREKDDKNPVICFDEKSRQLLENKYPSSAVKPGKPRRKDGEYVRHGTANLFVAVEPKAGKRHVSVTRQRRGEDVAKFLKKLVMNDYKGAKKVSIVLDNLNVHGPKTIRKHLPEQEVEALLERIDWRFTPKHASWLNMAEIEISVLSRQCLKRDMPTLEEMEKHVTAWQNDRNAAGVKIDWRFTRKDARKKFKLKEGIQ